jgi:hypothetical protein
LLSDFERFTSHNKAIKSAQERIEVIYKDEIAEAFLYSLSTYEVILCANSVR